MQPKHVVITLIILNLIFLGVFLLFTRSTIFDLWMLNKILPELCPTTQLDGTMTLGFCDEVTLLESESN